MIDIRIDNSAEHSAGTTATQVPAQTSARLALLSFTIGNQCYACDLRQVSEIRQLTTLARVAQMPDFIAGMVSVRGEIVPIVDLRIRFGLPPSTTLTNDQLCIITSIDKRVVGFKVDTVQDVIECDASQLQAAPDTVFAIAQKYLLGLLEQPEGISLLLDVQQLLDPAQLHQLNEQLPESLLP
jgi:purine-binding chemotaxis protein CheW